MDKDLTDANGFKNQPLMSADSQKVVKDHVDVDDGEDYSESNSLLPPRRDGMSRNTEKVRRKVQWNDSNGNKLAEILEFEPSEVGESDEEDSDSCICTIM